MTSNLTWPDEAVAEFCRRWNVVRLEVFGSALRDDFRDDSDVDVMVTPVESFRWSLLDIVRMERDLASILHHSVDLMTRRGVEQSRNEYRRAAILDSAETVYESR